MAMQLYSVAVGLLGVERLEVSSRDQLQDV